MGIEPTRLAWKARALPMSYTRMYRLLLLSYYTLFLFEVQVTPKERLPSGSQAKLLIMKPWIQNTLSTLCNNCYWFFRSFTLTPEKLLILTYQVI